MMRKVFSKSLIFLLALVFSTANPTVAVRLDIKEDQALLAMQKSVDHAINRIIKDEIVKELGIKTFKHSYPPFRKEKDFHITVLLDRKVRKRFESSAVHSLEVMQSLRRGSSPLHNIAITNNADLFGRDGEYLVLKVDDRDGELEGLRSDIRQAFLWLDDYYLHEPADRGVVYQVKRFFSWTKSLFKKEYRRLKKQGIFSSWLSKGRSYSPHVTLGIIPHKKIIRRVNSRRGNGQRVWQSIKQRVRKEVPAILKKLKQEHTMRFDSFVVYGSRRKMLKEFFFKNRKRIRQKVFATA